MAVARAVLAVAQDAGARFRPPSAAHLFGTDGFGRDVLSRVIAGARPVLTIAPLAVLLATLAGTDPRAHHRLLRWRHRRRRRCDCSKPIAVLPPLFPVVLAVALLGRSTAVLVIVLAFAFTPIVTWTVRAATLVERERQFVEAARLRGERAPYILGREILPNISGSDRRRVDVRLADAVFAIATLAFIGLGAAPGSPDWGAQVADNRVNLQFAWWTVLFPAVAVASLVIAVSLLADVAAGAGR